MSHVDRIEEDCCECKACGDWCDRNFGEDTDCCDKYCPDGDECEGRCLKFCVTLLIVTPYVVLVPFIAYPWLGITSWGLLGTWLPTILFVLILWSYHKASVSDPGYVDPTWRNWKNVDGTPMFTYTDEELKYCKICQMYKPPRAHHCSVSRRCVLKMDHRCPFVNNCVGALNYKYFVQFLVYATSGLLYATVLVIARAISFKGTTEPIPQNIMLTLVISGVVVIPLTIAVGCLAGYHVYLVSINVTTIESSIMESKERQQNRRLRERARRRKRGELDDENGSSDDEDDPYFNAYDLGFRGNWAAVLLPSALLSRRVRAPLWSAFLPLYRPPLPRSYGYVFETNKKTAMKAKEIV